jgi:A118 family predicted phage portal protein
MLPTDPHAEWPPVAVRPVLRETRELAAWYSDDVDALYPLSITAQQGANWRLRFRADHGARNLSNNRGELDTLHVPAAADIARVSADLLFSESPKITCENDAAQLRLEDLFEDMNYDAMLVENAELCAALAGVFWRCTWDLSMVADRPILAWTTPDYAVPEFRWGLLSAVTFWEVLAPPANTSRDAVWRALERHSSTPSGALIEHGLYVGTGTELGRAVPLTDHPDTAGIAASLTGDQTIFLPGVPMTAGYVPNMRPNRKARGTPLGRADIAGQDDVLRAVDKTWSSWMRDLDLGKGRAIVPQDFLRDYGPGLGAGFELDRAIYSGINMPPTQGVSPITLMQFKIRTDEHAATLTALMGQMIRSAGYSLRSFGLADNSKATTATEVKAQERASMITREKKTRYWGQAMSDQLECLMALDRFLGFAGSVDSGDITVEFGDSVSEEPHRIAETVELINRAAASSVETRVQMLHPDWDAEAVAGEVARIQNETSVPDPMGVPEAAIGGGTPMPAGMPVLNGAPGANG